MKDDELTPSEKRAIDALPRDKEPSAFLEERTVQALRKRGTLGPRSRRHIEVTPARLVGAIAASIALVIGGFALGQRAGSHVPARPVLETVDTSDLELAAGLQRTGTAYVSALNQFAERQRSQDAATSAEAVQGREVALNTLYAAADETSRIVPDRAVASVILHMLDGTVGSAQAATQDASRESVQPRTVIWF